MRKTNIFSAMLSLFLLVPASIIWAQTISSQKGLTTAVFNLLEGKIKVYLPDDIRPGESITGMVVTETSGNNAKEKSKNINALIRYSIRTGSNTITVPESSVDFEWILPAGQTLVSPLQLQNEDGKIISELALQFNTTSYASVPGIYDYKIERKILLTDDLLQLCSPYGNIKRNMKYLLEDAAGKKILIKPKVQSSRQAIFELPNEITPGNTILSIQVSGGDRVPTDQVSFNFSVIKFEFKAQKASLLKGEKTTIWWQLKGVDTNRVKLPLVVLENLSPEHINIPAGNYQVASVTRGNTDTRHEQTITAIVNGPFNINATVYLPADAYCDPFSSQLRVIKTKKDYDAWTGALKKDLLAYIEKQGTDILGAATSRNAQTVIDNIPLCSDDSKVTDCLATVNYYLRYVSVPRAAAYLWLTGLEAYKAGIKYISAGNRSKPEIIDWDIIRNGLNFMEVSGKEMDEAILQKKTKEAQQLLEFAQKINVTSNELAELKNKLEELNQYTKENKIGMDIPPEHHYDASWLSQVSWNEFLDKPVNYYDLPATGGENKTDTVPCKRQQDELQRVEESLQALKDELAGIDASIGKARKDTVGCGKAIADKKQALANAGNVLNNAKNRVRSLESGGKVAPEKETKALTKAGEDRDKADADLKAQIKNCDDKTQNLRRLISRKDLLPYKIGQLEAELTAAKTELEKCKQKAAEEKKKKEDEAKRLEDEARNAAASAAQKEEQRRKTIETNSYVMINIHELGLMSAGEFWDMKGVWDVIPAIAAHLGIDLTSDNAGAVIKALGDGGEDMAGVPGSTDIIQALGGIYQIIAAMKDPCIGLGMSTTVQRLMARVNKATGTMYTNLEAQDKTEMMCNMILLVKKISAIGARK